MEYITLCTSRFQGVSDLDDVATKLQEGFSAISSNISVTRFLSTATATQVPSFSIFSNSSDDTFEIERHGVSGYGKDLLDLVDPILSEYQDGYYLGKTIKHFRYPDDRHDITHYSLYRSLDIYPHTLEPKDLTDPRIVNAPYVLGWVDDIPVCKIFKIDDITLNIEGDYISTITDVRFSEHDVGCTVYHGSGSGYTDGNFKLIKYQQDPGTYTADGATFEDTDVYCWIGAESLQEFSKDEGKIRLVSGDHVMSEDDIGKLVFWHDGSYDIIEDFGTDGSGDYILAIDKGSKDTSYALMNPTSREYNDSTGEQELSGYTTEFPLNTRFFDQMPNTNIAAYYNGILLSAKFGETSMAFSDCIELHKMGYKNATRQINDSLERAITSIKVVNGYFTITSEDTHIINPAQNITGGDPNQGEAYTILQDPILIAKGVGSTHQSKWIEGLPDGLGLVTNEPAVRIFNGTGYGPNLAEGFIQRTKLQRLDSLVLGVFDKHSGLYLWGKTT